MLIGHQKQWIFLKRAWEQGSLPHGLLFSGPDQVGKKTLALELIKLINCRLGKPGPDACGQCSCCLALANKTHPDFFLLQLDPENTQIQINQVRQLIGQLSLKPFLADFKAAVIDEAHLLSFEAQNCLLKTIEEPSGRTLLILISHQPQGLSGTVRSRVQEIKFFPLAETEMKAFLEEKGIKEKDREEIIRFSLGRPGRALEYWQNPGRLKEEQSQFEQLTKILGADLKTRFSWAEKAAGDHLQKIIETGLIHLREMFLAKDFSRLSYARIKKTMNGLEELNFLLKSANVNQRLAVESFLLEQE